MIVSCSAVMPHGARRSTAFSFDARSADGRERTKKFSLNATSVTRSVGRSADRKRFTFSFTTPIESVMLPLTSTPTASSSGMFSDAKWLIACGLSSS